MASRASALGCYRIGLVVLMIALSACSTTGRVARTTPTPDTVPAAATAEPQPAVELPPVRSDAALRKPLAMRDYPDLLRPAGLPQATADANTMVAHFINVGQGDATLLEFSCGAVLIDTGGENTSRVLGRDRLHDYLEEFFGRRADLARTLDLVVLSHPHADHTDGVQALLEAEPAIVILNVVDNGPLATGSRDSGRAGQSALWNYANSTEGVGYRGITESQIETVSGATDEVIDPINCRRGNSGVDPRIAALWGRVDIDVPWAKNANNDSVVLRVDFGQASFLFLGDAEHQGLSAMLESYELDTSAFDVDVMKVGHHGSKNATTADFVSAVTPKIAVIQTGDSSPDPQREQFSAFEFGHPNRVAIDLLLDPANGVSMDRPLKEVRVGIKGRALGANAPPPVFTNIQLRKAIYANGWDGNIAVIANADGSLSVEAEY